MKGLLDGRRVHLTFLKHLSLDLFLILRILELLLVLESVCQILLVLSKFNGIWLGDRLECSFTCFGFISLVKSSCRYGWRLLSDSGTMYCS